MKNLRLSLISIVVLPSLFAGIAGTLLSIQKCETRPYSIEVPSTLSTFPPTTTVEIVTRTRMVKTIGVPFPYNDAPFSISTINWAYLALNVTIAAVTSVVIFFFVVKEKVSGAFFRE